MRLLPYEGGEAPERAAGAWWLLCDVLLPPGSVLVNTPSGDGGSVSCSALHSYQWKHFVSLTH